MKQNLLCLLLIAGLLLLPGCGREEASQPAQPTAAATQAATVPTEETVPATVPPDGSPDDVTCKGTYTGQPQADAVVARTAQAELTNGQLQAWYWAEAAAYQQSGQTPAPDFSRDLATQPCEIDASVGSWQQYFLRRALNSWHTAQALIRQGQEEGLPVEEEYQPSQHNYEIYMEGMPATKVLYRYEKSYSPNAMHQAYLDSMEQTLGALAQAQGLADAQALAQETAGTSLENLITFARDYNWAYMYFTNLSYYLEPTQEQVEEARAETSGEEGRYVDIRHILLVPDGVAPVSSTHPNEEPEQTETVTVAQDGTVTCSETAWEYCRVKAESMLEPWTKGQYGATESAFADLAYRNSADDGSADDGGAYRQISRGQLIDELDAWSFDESRQSGDTAVLRSPYGYHLVYFVGSTDIGYAQAEEALKVRWMEALVEQAREDDPMEVDYAAITLGSGTPAVSYDDILYPDLAHERFTEVPLYLQQDYPTTLFGGYRITTNGCGITTMSMIASYLADDELTPPEMCRRYGLYSYANGTNGELFVKEPAGLGFFLKEKTYDPTVALEALKEGRIVVSIQHKGYWTSGGHYITLEKYNEDGTIQVRDSNIYNYGRISSHAEDKHTWASITSAGSGFWIFEPKVTAIPACSRCGHPEELDCSLLNSGYLCRKCRPAILRRETFLEIAGN